MHSSQIYTPGPATSLRTSDWLLPQKLHIVRLDGLAMEMWGKVENGGWNGAVRMASNRGACKDGSAARPPWKREFSPISSRMEKFSVILNYFLARICQFL